MKRFRPYLLGCSLFLLLFCAIVSAVAYWRRADIAAIWDVIALTSEQSYTDPLATPDEVLTYLQRYSDTVGFMAYSVNSDGSPMPESIIAHNANQSFVLASTIKIVILGAYAREVEAGRLNPNDPVTLAEWERFYLPNTDGGAHPAALDALQIPHAYGFANDPNGTVTLDQIAEAMIRFSDNAATDVLLFRVGQAAMAATISEAGMSRQEAPIPISGAFLLWQNHEKPDVTASDITALVALPREEIATQAWRLAEQMNAAGEWYQAERQWRNEQQPSVPIRLQSEIVKTTPRGTPQDYAYIMGQVATDTFFSPEVTAIMRPHLEWPMQFEENQARFTSLGSKGGSFVGVMTGATYYIPKTGDFAGQPRVVVLFMNDIPFSAWLTLAQNFAHQGFEFEVATNNTFATQVRNSVE